MGNAARRFRLTGFADGKFRLFGQTLEWSYGYLS
jgi:hypothetical protein